MSRHNSYRVSVACHFTLLILLFLPSLGTAEIVSLAPGYSANIFTTLDFSSRAFTFDSDHNLYAMDRADDSSGSVRIYVLHPSDSYSTRSLFNSYDTGTCCTNGLSFNSGETRLFVSEAFSSGDSGLIREFDTTTFTITANQSLPDYRATGVAVDGTGTILFPGRQASAPNFGNLYRISVSGTPEIVVDGFVGTGITIDASGNIYGSTPNATVTSPFSANTIYKFDPVTFDTTLVATFDSKIDELAADRSGNIYALENPTNPTIYQISSNAASATTLAASSLPASRSVELVNTATAFATIINAGSVTATACTIAPVTNVPASFSYQTTDPTTNALTGTSDTPIDIPAGGLQTFLFAFTPTAAFNPIDVQLSFDCANSSRAPIVTGLNTLVLSAASTPVPDIVALAATLQSDGIVHIPDDSGTGVFAVAVVNVGSPGSATVSSDVGSALLPVTIRVCETNPLDGTCFAPPAASVSAQIGAGATPTFAFFVDTSAAVPLDPANNRVFVRFVDTSGITRGSTSVAVEGGAADTSSVPNITGIYVGSGTVTNTGCSDFDINRSFDVFVNIDIFSQEGPNFGGRNATELIFEGALFTGVDTLDGTVNADGNISGTLDGVFEATRSTGTFTGHITDNTLIYNFVSQDTVGETCTTTGSISATR